MRVSAGTDPITGGRHVLDEIIPLGPDAAKLAEKARTRLLAEVDEQRNTRTKATVNQLLDRYFKWLNRCEVSGLVLRLNLVKACYM